MSSIGFFYIGSISSHIKMERKIFAFAGTLCAQEAAQVI
jgi:hypothetical protein